MDLNHAEQIVSFLNEEGTDASVYEEYSGRGMFGSTTTGVVAPTTQDVIRAAAELKIKQCKAFRWDNLGRDMIVY